MEEEEESKCAGGDIGLCCWVCTLYNVSCSLFKPIIVFYIYIFINLNNLLS